MRWTRRLFVQRVGITTGGFVWTGFAGAMGCGGRRPMLSERQGRAVPAARRYFDEGRLEDAREIGRTYVTAENAGQSRVDGLLEPTVSIVEGNEDAVPRLASRVTADFTELRVQNVAGWTVSDTELSLCLLLELSPGTRM